MLSAVQGVLGTPLDELEELEELEPLDELEDPELDELEPASGFAPELLALPDEDEGLPELELVFSVSEQP
jgi:hypothetical protein